MARDVLNASELERLEKGLNSETRVAHIRLREGEYQLDLAKALASFELGLRFPDVKDLISKLYGENKTEDMQFIRKIQTILKKMERSGVVEILPKKKPWELQRYALSSFKFQDVEKNLIVLAAESEVKKALESIRTQPDPKRTYTAPPSHVNARILVLISAVLASYAIIIWAVTQPATNALIFAVAFIFAATCSVLLGAAYSRKR